MKKILVLIISIISITIYAEDIHSFYVKYKIEGINSGILEIYIKDNGEKEAYYSTVELSYGKYKDYVRTGLIKNRDILYTLNFKNKTYFNEKIEEDYVPTYEFDFSKYEKVGNGKILDVNTEIYKVGNSYYWVYKGIILKSLQVINSNKIKTNAIEFIRNLEIPEEKFDIPEGFILVDNPLNKLFKKEDNLKKEFEEFKEDLEKEFKEFKKNLNK
ncbi:hypothetical protein EV215_0525 [Hypnocyclicus thermotrophus]|uniref:DUF4412 domain-containing protein n=1 Tax=Hypnocyclicus thermotrophus TaxID=1627895 RepID=A0AA46E025_9FUSO|nr:hypothetical protein [Hypnocyclicus thermotrophus]TDT71836.1 hypothetical protein EV215_0525 [Hypnocyclicus thermotrophus]